MIGADAFSFYQGIIVITNWSRDTALNCEERFASQKIRVETVK